ncbi:MAG: DUF2723 domain-containing protein [Saprospiraceae bacterium]|nr:DUF2723 domain-containing protein [Saprospiraceae bacterium]
MSSLKKTSNIVGIIVFLITMIVYYNSVEWTGSLWDCGEFILGAYKLQVVHPPGAGLFVIIGRIFAWVATLVSDDPANIAFAINLMSAISTSIACVMIAWTTIMFGKIALVGKEVETTAAQNLALAFGGIVAGLATGFSTSIWFSAVEGEVYAMSTMFTAMTLWAATKYYFLPNELDSNRWLVFSLFSAGMSVGVHLLSILVLPAVALMVYFKKYKKHTFLGALAAMGVGVVGIVFILKVIITGIPTLWKNMELLMVNNFGLPPNTGLIPTLLLIGALGYFALKLAHRSHNQIIQDAAISAIFVVMAFSTVGVIVIRANADTPINMNAPSDAMRLLPYLNREQYGERPLLIGPAYDAEPSNVTRSPRYGLVGDKYKIVDEKYDYVYAAKDKMLFPRIGHTDQSRPELHKLWRRALNGDDKGKPGMGYNLQFLFHYQIGWMYYRYFMWNFVGRQTAEQGYFPWDVSKGQWASGVTPIDEARLYKMDKLPDTMKNDQSRNYYFFLPLIFGLIGLFWHLKRSKKEFVVLLALFIITGLGIIIFSNQPPNEPRERDYVLVGSFMTFCIWMGLSVPALYSLIENKIKGIAPAALLGLLVLSAPVIMGFQNFDDHSRKEHTAARDYASNFLNSVAPNSIIFTYGDNDTYPLWYAQEVENIRRDVRVVNLSLIAVDWYIDKLRRKVNDSPPLKLTLSPDDYRGKNRNQIFFFDPLNGDMSTPMNVYQALRQIRDPKYTVEDQTYINTKRFFIPVDREKYNALGQAPVDSTQWVDRIEFGFEQNQRSFLKDDLAVMDVIASNFYDRPIYFAITCQPGKLLGLNDYLEMDGLALRITPTKIESPSQLPSIYGYGDINADLTREIILNKWKWGNFDNGQRYVDKSYMAEVQAMKLVMLRDALEFDRKKEYAKSAEMANKYFEAFPHQNFAYDFGITPFINILVNAKDFESAKKHLRILGMESKQYIEFYESQTDNSVFESFADDYQYRLRAVSDVLEISKRVEDPAFEKEMSDLLSPLIEKATENEPNKPNNIRQ